MEWTPSVARAASEAALASCSSSAKVLLHPLLLLRLLLPALLLQLALPLLLGLLLREEDVGDRYVDLGDPQAHQALHTVDDVAAHRLGELRDGLAVLGRQRQVGAASSCPTSTETPWVWLPLPPVMEPRIPPTACEAPLPILMPSTSWAAIPAILETTLSEMLVLPRSVWSGLLLC